jgi:hypothetical protein
MSYTLARRGAAELNRARSIEIPLTRWKSKNLALKQTTINHELAASRFLARLWHDAMRYSEPVEVFHQADFMEPPRGNKGLPNILTAQIRGWYGHTTRQGTAPDRIVSFTAQGRQHYLLVEVDEATETIAPRESLIRSRDFWDDTSLLRKFVIYSAAFKTKAHQTIYKIPVFRVVTVTTSAARVQNMVAACQTHLTDTPPGLFLFTDWQTLEASDAPIFDLKFVNGAGRPVSLL